MPADIINLRRARKAKARSKDEKAAEQNRPSGRTTAEKRKDADERERSLTHLEGHRIGPGKDEPA